MRIVSIFSSYLFMLFNLLKTNRVCNGLPGAYLDSETCTMNYTAAVVGMWVIALKIEDFQQPWQSVPLSGTSLQFIVIVQSNANTNISRMKLFNFDRRSKTNYLYFMERSSIFWYTTIGRMRHRCFQFNNKRCFTVLSWPAKYHYHKY